MMVCLISLLGQKEAIDAVFEISQYEASEMKKVLPFIINLFLYILFLPLD